MYSNEEDRSDAVDTPVRRPWIVLKNSYDVEAWIDNYNRDLQRLVKKTHASGYGICFSLSHGGDIFMHTNNEGDVLLDVTPDAQWVTPLIARITQTDTPASQIWAMPGELLTQLVLGLSSLIESSTMVLEHDFKIRKY